MGVFSEVIDQIAPANVEHGAGRNECAESDPFLQTPVQDRRFERAALAKKRDVASQRHVVGKCRVQP